MKDVFIVNPKSGKNSQYELIKEIKEHFQGKRIIIEKTHLIKQDIDIINVK